MFLGLNLQSTIASRTGSLVYHAKVHPFRKSPCPIQTSQNWQNYRSFSVIDCRENRLSFLSLSLSLQNPAAGDTATPYSIWHRNTAPHCNFLKKEPGPSPGDRFLLAPLGAQSRKQFLSSSTGPSPGDIIPAGLQRLQALLLIEAGANILQLFWKFARATMQW